MRIPPIRSAAPPREEAAASHRHRLDLLTTPFFLVCLGTLLLNDFVLKDAFNNWLTDKLSDFAGVPVFALFLTAFRPRQRLPIFVGTAIAFTLWKSPLSQPAIDAWNDLGLLHIARVVDYTDLMALLMLPFAYLSIVRRRPRGGRMTIRIAVAGVASFAIMATSSAAPTTEYDNVYQFPVERTQLIERIKQLGFEYRSPPAKTPVRGNAPPHFMGPVVLEVPAEICRLSESRIDATIVAEETNAGSQIRLTSIEPRCYESGLGPAEFPEPEEFLEIFETSVINRLREMTASQ